MTAIRGPKYTDIHAFAETWSTAALEDADGLKTSIATSTSAAQYTGTPAAHGDWNGAEAADFLDGRTPARTVSVTTTTSAGTYKTGADYPIVVTGTRDGVVVTENLLLTQANGNETIRGSQPFDGGVEVTDAFTVDIPGQNDTNGFFTFGVQDLCADEGKVFRGVKSAGSGSVFVQYQREDANGVKVTDVIPVNTGDKEIIGAERVRSTDGTSSTDVGVTVCY